MALTAPVDATAVTDWTRAPLGDLTARKATSRLGLCPARHPAAIVMAETVQVPQMRQMLGPAPDRSWRNPNELERVVTAYLATLK